MQAIILDGGLKSALCATRSLGQKGVRVSVGAERRTAMARHSRYASRTFTYPSPYTKAEGFLEALKKEATHMDGKPLVYALSDATSMLLSRNRETLKDSVTLLLSSPESLEMVSNKAETSALAQGLGIPTITTYLPVSRDDLRSSIGALAYPIVMKTRHSVTWRDGEGIFGTAVFVHTEAEQARVFDRIERETGEAPLVQPFVKGEEYGVEFLAKDGRVFAESAHHRIRSLRPTGGASVIKETLGDTELAGIMKDYAQTLVEALMWTGPIMVEFKVDAIDNTPKLMEINGRFWGSLPLAVRAGTDFPYLYYEMAEGRYPETLVTSKGGITTQHFLGDVRHLGSVLFANDRMRSYLYPSRTRQMWRFLRGRFGTAGDIFSFSDIQPSLMEYIDSVAKILK